MSILHWQIIVPMQVAGSPGTSIGSAVASHQEWRQAAISVRSLQPSQSLVAAFCEETGQLHEWQAAILSRITMWQKMQLLSCPHCKRSELRGIVSRRSTRVKMR